MARTLRRSHAAHEGPRGIPGRAGALQAGPGLRLPGMGGSAGQSLGAREGMG